ncbi:hypothetical protein [Streptomyces griseoloalbus]|uniref:Tryptophan 2,3-dioxygenase n=1 Tax=Streptomyces griseoloalbus TaxID=67303 RepID=A0A7W8F836_9ACTN|nr:hypothetical protein [Streptomyces albaduncus]MBB5124819.1 tryptophan 2,3-dioxygenase [Streptomyces albaduncus]GGV70982.1 hypothetical protein GCM10010294_29710 [Streptomyces griseoloalbus]GGW39626.1 hypothetical protein GCM10010340_16920 [Streptomyces albaduncus]
MRTAAVLRAVLDFDMAHYIDHARSVGRDRLDPALRARMAEAYEDVTVALALDGHRLGRQERAVLRLAELVFQAEWKLALPEGESPQQVAARGGGPLDRRGKRYQPYGNVRLLNHVLGTRWHAPDGAVERACWQAVRAVASGWRAYEQRTVDGTETWARDALPEPGQLAERIERLDALVSLTAGRAPALRPAAATPPRHWRDYLLPHGRANILEHLTVLPQTTQHDEVTFLRVIHLVEATTWGVLARVMSAAEWLRARRWEYAAECLDRAAVLAAAQTQALLVMRRTMPVEHFHGFRAATGDASAVQAFPTQLLHIHLLGVHPEKVEALHEATENAYVLLHQNPDFEPLRDLLHRVPGEAAGRHVLDAAHRLDQELYAWRKIHYGVAVRYLPQQSTGSGGTSGAPYLRSFYQDRLFDADRTLLPQHRSATTAAPDAWVRARPALSPFN